MNYHETLNHYFNCALTGENGSTLVSLSRTEVSFFSGAKVKLKLLLKYVPNVKL